MFFLLQNPLLYLQSRPFICLIRHDQGVFVVATCAAYRNG
jgi:hypothetical protein